MPVTTPVAAIVHITRRTSRACMGVISGTNEALSAMTNMSNADPVVSARTTYIGPALIAGSGLTTKRTAVTTIRTATTKSTSTSRNRLALRIDRGATLGRGLFESLLIRSPV